MRRIEHDPEDYDSAYEAAFGPDDDEDPQPERKLLTARERCERQRRLMTETLSQPDESLLPTGREIFFVVIETIDKASEACAIGANISLKEQDKGDLGLAMQTSVQSFFEGKPNKPKFICVLHRECEHAGDDELPLTAEEDTDAIIPSAPHTRILIGSDVVPGGCPTPNYIGGERCMSSRYFIRNDRLVFECLKCGTEKTSKDTIFEVIGGCLDECLSPCTCEPGWPGRIEMLCWVPDSAQSGGQKRIIKWYCCQCDRLYNYDGEPFVVYGGENDGYSYP
jgi:hypothetical protein